MTTLHDALSVLRALAPEDTALPGDPTGLLVSGPLDAPLAKIAVCLDATPEACERAVSDGAGLLVTHHPLLYHPLKRLDWHADPISRAVATLVRGNVSLYAMHTNWDRAAGGINDTLAALLGLQDARPLGPDGLEAIARIGTLPAPLSFREFARFVGDALGCAGTSALRLGDAPPDLSLSRVAVCGGAGAELMGAARDAGADCYVTSDVRHHEFLEAAGIGLALIDAGHGATETPGMRALVPLLSARLPGVEAAWAGGA